jgi:hypothetical protein
VSDFEVSQHLYKGNFNRSRFVFGAIQDAAGANLASNNPDKSPFSQLYSNTTEHCQYASALGSGVFAILVISIFQNSEWTCMDEFNTR